MDNRRPVADREQPSAEPLSPRVIENLLTNFEKRSLPARTAIGFGLIPAIGAIDFLTGYELAFSLFYVMPISLVTWSVGRRLGMIASLLSAMAWFAADVATGHPYSNALIPVWNTLIRLAFFLIITSLLSSLSSLTARERELSRTDSLTGAANSRLFAELTQMEIDRLHRYGHPFSLAYIDLDNFKAMNDRFGHSTGDDILRTVALTAKNHLRTVDVVARLGGDEFAILLPETDQDSASIIVARVRNLLLDAMDVHGWSITFSIGVLTCITAPDSTDDVVRMADELMYSVKRARKNAMRFSAYTGRETGAVLASAR